MRAEILNCSEHFVYKRLTNSFPYGVHQEERIGSWAADKDLHQSQTLSDGLQKVSVKQGGSAVVGLNLAKAPSSGYKPREGGNKFLSR